MEPVVFTDVTPGMSLAKKELFSPLISILKSRDDKSVLSIVNDTVYGLSRAVHTRNIERGTELAKQMDTGMIHINDGTINDKPNVTFGGMKNSDIGRLNGEWSLDAFTTTKWISLQHNRVQYPYS